MRPVKPARIQSVINVTPLVDVVLVLLIIFMVMAPHLRKGPEVDLPETAKPHKQGDEAPIRVTIDERGGLWIDDEPVAAEGFGERLRAVAGSEPNAKVVIQGDAQLRLGQVRQAMLAIEEAGFHGLGLLAHRAGGEAAGGGD